MINLQTKAHQVHDTLNAAYQPPPFQPHGPPLEQLILTLLSANTNDVNSGRAFDQLMAAFNGDWEAIRTAPLDAIKTAIRPAGMYNQKAPHIVATLTLLKEEQGSYNLDHLMEMDVAEAVKYLTRFPGVGHKTASIVMLFCFNAGAFPVDTHVQRITQRLGISARKASPEKIKVLWEGLLPPETYYALHVNLIQHGREVCLARKPRCTTCAVHALCDYTHGRGEWAEEG